MNKEHLKHLYDKANNYLSLSFLNPKLINLLKTNEMMEKLIKQLIDFVSCVNETEEGFEKVDINSYLAGYKSTLNKDLDINKQPLSAILDNSEDVISYFPKFVYNSLQLSIEDLENELRNSSSNSIQQIDSAQYVDSEVVQNNNQNNEQEPIDPNNSSNQNFNAEDFIKNSGYSMNDIADGMISQMAANRLNNEVRNGTVFLYKNKPKLIPILKYLSVVLFIAYFILSIAAFALIAVVSPKIEIKLGTAQDGSAVNGYLFSVGFPFQLIFSLLITVMIVYSLIRNIKNDNVKYRYAWGWIAFYLAFMFISIFLTIIDGTTPLTNPNYFIDLINNQGTNPIEQISAFHQFIDPWRGIQFAEIAIVIALVIILVIAAILNPKKDVERINNLLIQYMDDIKSGRDDPSKYSSNNGASSFFGNGFF